MTIIRFNNHASVTISSGDVFLLTDPWFQGSAFNKGWELLVQQTDDEILDILEHITHIWVSHEHPDHFSVMFFKKFLNVLLSKNIEVLFQKIDDQRVKSFLIRSGLRFQELEFEKKVILAEKFSITCFKDGFYDSALLVETADQKILNLNDCDVTTEARAKEIFSVTGECDVLLTQFSYAAWKGGKLNERWRKEAADEKLNTIKLQVRVFKPQVLIPFASFVYFSNEDNNYLNDSVNSPEKVIEAIADYDVNVLVMKPGDQFHGYVKKLDVDNAVEFWRVKYAASSEVSALQYDVRDLEALARSFETYRNRVFNNNSCFFMWLARYLSPISV